MRKDEVIMSSGDGFTINQCKLILLLCILIVAIVLILPWPTIAPAAGAWLDSAFDAIDNF